MSLPILGDTHWGARKDSPLFYRHFERFYDRFIDDCVKNGHKVILQVGDLFDVRNHTNMVTFTESKRIFFNPLKEAGITLYTIVGNHDAYYRESIKVNTPRLLLTEFEYTNIVVVDTPMTVRFDGAETDLIPWICEENREEILSYIQNSTAKNCAGHFEIAGFSMYKGIEAHDGLDMALFNKYDNVWSGHYHHRQRRGNITYVGTPYELSWQDYGDPKGYHVYNHKDDTLTFLENSDKIFIQLTYDDTAPMVEVPDLTDKFVKVKVLNNTDPVKFEGYFRPVAEVAFDVDVIQDMTLTVSGTIDMEKVQMKDTLTLMEAYVDATETTVDKAELKRLLRETYVEAINEEAP